MIAFPGRRGRLRGVLDVLRPGAAPRQALRQDQALRAEVQGKEAFTYDNPNEFSSKSEKGSISVYVISE